MDLSYCPRCSKLFAKGLRDVCNNCIQAIEKEYETVHTYLKENKGANIQQVSDDTEVPVKQITKFIREGRISTSNMPNMSIPCEVCGLPIRESNMCDSCRSKLQRDMKNLRTGQGGLGSSQTTSHDPRNNSSFQIRDRS
jgi:flagellar operon protein (TIGR03826 family)